MSIKELSEKLKVVNWISPNGTPCGSWFDLDEIEDEETYDQYQFSINYDFKKERFVCYVACYRAGEDNNCENQEGHTEEVDYYTSTLEELINTLANEYGNIFEEPFYKKIKEEN